VQSAKEQEEVEAESKWVELERCSRSGAGAGRSDLADGASTS
jgi:hypothetical protein